METIYFLLFIAACIVVLVWAMNRSKKQTDLVPRSRKQSENNLLQTPADHVLTHKQDLWERRRKYAARDVGAQKKFVPKFEQKAQPEYDGYSRRDRHHVTPKANVRRERHVEDVDNGISSSAPKFGSDRRTPSGATKH